MINVNKFSAMQVGLASPEKILEWSHGEVKKPETINYRSQKPERDGLFCERIFGPTKDWECHCGKYKKVRYKGVVCDRCGVEVTKSSVRRERMGHIDLAAPVAHIWYLKGTPSRMGLILDMAPKLLEEIIYFVSYVVTDPGDTSLEYKQVISEREYRMHYEKFGNAFKAKIGAEAVQTLLKQVDLEKEFADVQKELKEVQGQRRTKLLKRLEVIEAFRSSSNQPEWMILGALPVIPPDLRPMLQLDGGRFATSDLNDLYRRVITRNNRLKKLLELGTPSIIVQNEKRMLQEAVDALIDNGRRSKAITGAGGRPLKSISHALKGKQGRFRQNLLGKRVDYSGRSVIAVGPDLNMYQCGLPKEMALELFRPFVIHETVKRELAQNIKAAEGLIERMDERIWDIVEDVIKEHPVLLNRAPTLHRLGIQAFEPKLVEGRAIRLHPLVTPAFNADFDGDQMAVHVPLSQEACAEARLLMLGSNNILGPKDGKPIVTPGQDMVLGNYYLTIEDDEAPGEGMVFKNQDEMMRAYHEKIVHLHTRIAIRAASLGNHTFTEKQNSGYLITTVGKLIFNEIFSNDFPFINEPNNRNLSGTPDEYFVPLGTNIKEHIKNQKIIKPFTKKTLSNLINEVFKRFKTSETSKMLDKMKDQGFKYSTVAGVTVSIADINVSDEKYELFKLADQLVEKAKVDYRKGRLTEEERKQHVISIWNDVKDEVQQVVKTNFESNPKNPIFMMSDSGARGNISNFTQLVGMRGLMANAKGETMEIPIKSSFREGLTVSEFFTSTHGARKGLADTAIRTAESGYLTRRLVDVAQDVIVDMDDCGTDRGFIVETIVNTKDNSTIVPLYDRLVGRNAKNDIVNPTTGKIIVEGGELITEDTALLIVQAGIEKVEIRSIFGCNSKNGVCRKCYGRNLATGMEVEIGESVGIMAAQSIGEPGTQLTMRTFHTGGVAGGSDITQGLPRIQELFEARVPKAKERAVISEIAGVIREINNNQGRYEVIVENNLEQRDYLLPFNATLRVKQGDTIKIGAKISEGSIDPKELLLVSDESHVQNYILKEVQKVYRMQGIEIADKHIEVMIRQMLRKVVVIEGGDTRALPGTLMSVPEFTSINHDILLDGLHPAVARPILLGITKASLETESFLSAASFQETTRILTDAAIKGKIDYLAGLKENVIIGKLIPAGTGLKKYNQATYQTVEAYEELDTATEEDYFTEIRD